MHSRFRAKSVTLVALAALMALLAVPGTLLAKPKPGAPGRGFRLQARAIGALTINRVYCGLAATGEICVDSTNSSTIGGGYWPKGSPQQYVFNSGLQAAGTVDTSAGFSWAGDTTGAFFFDPKGTTQHGQLVQPIWNYSDPNDQANWPQAAYVPSGDASELNFDVNLRGLPSASQGDVWTVAWDGDPSLSAGRPHPLGIAVETRGLGWNYPAGNEDIVYFIYTFYNVTSANPADYAAIRPGMQELMLGLGQQFQALNNAAYGITMPTGGYTIKDFYANFSADMDVSSDAGANYSSVNIPFALGYVYEHTFRGPEGNYRLPGALSSPPFTNGYGFVGVKYLKSPTVDPDGAGPLPEEEVGISLFSNTINGGVFGDPANTYQLYRYVSGNINPGLGDGLCNFDPVQDKICYVKNDASADMRFFQSSGPFDLAPGSFGSVVVGYVFASAIASPGCNVAGCGGAEVRPNDPRLLSDAGTLGSVGANLIDSMTGFRGYNDANGDLLVQQNEFVTVKGSLLGKSLVAQTVFNSRFLLPSAPNAPEFFLVPGDDQVAIFWRPSTSETAGDLFFPAASSAGTPASPNLLYDPNYRQFDVEGYRIYRGRQDDPSALSMLAQYDYAGTDAAGHSTTFRDYLGVVNPTPVCAPELGKFTLAGGCPVNFGAPPAAGNPYTVFTTASVGGTATTPSPFLQVKLGDRVLLANGDALVVKADTSVTGADYGGTELQNGGVPFVYVDLTAKNNLRYFYAVTAFDVNSIQSGPSSLESARITKSAIPVHPASNYDNVGNLSIGMFGRGVNMSAAIPKAPAINGTTGTFSGPARPATGAQIGFVGDFVKQVVTASGEMSVTLDSMKAGSPYDATAATAARYYYTILSAAGSTSSVVSVIQSQANAAVTASGNIDGGPIDGERAARYGGSTAYHLAGTYNLTYAGTYYTSTYGRGCVNAAPGFVSATRCAYNGARWFEGATETFAHPNQGNGPNTTAATPAISNWTNAGSLAGSGVLNIWEGRSYQTRPNVYRSVEAVIGSAATAADYKVFWGAAGAVDSVVDVTHNVLVPFAADMRNGYTWGFLTQAAATVGGNSADLRTQLTLADIGCVQPIKSFPTANGHLACPGGVTYNFVNTLAFGPVAFGTTLATDGSAPQRANPGFGMYLAGHFFMFEMNSGAPAAPTAGTVWTMRSYTGAISGGGGSVGTAGNLGAYAFAPQPSPFNAVGASLKAAYSVTNTVVPATEAGLELVHTVPDPYYVTNGYEVSPTNKVIKFVNLPVQSIVRIYSTSGVLVRVLEHNSSTFGGSLDWDVRNRNNQVVASGVYFYHIEAVSGERRVGRMTIVNFAQ
jgi:hypothetical protein